MYQAGEYDLAGFAVGSVKKADFIDGSSIAEGDAVLGLPSSGVHANGFSLVRKILQASWTASFFEETAASLPRHQHGASSPVRDMSCQAQPPRQRVLLLPVLRR